ncbi:MAG: glutamine synthetase family protein [Candidatus Pacebacteria bacterium]|nr:glutamine synthetase family protein [Candidatus Paceibacterota bacterium]
MTDFVSWIKENRVTEVECLVPDMSGLARGKIMPVAKFLSSLKDKGLRIPEAIFVQSISGVYPDDYDDLINPQNSDVYLVPDITTLRLVPWYSEPTAQVICDCYYADGKPVGIASRQVLQRVLALYKAKGWTPIVAPELEFYLVETNTDPDYPLSPPVGRSGRKETAHQSYGIDSVNEFDPIFEDVYDYCEVQQIDIDTLSHEEGAGQIEINFNHGEALSLADQVFSFKRTVRQTALAHKVYATFMSKPMENEPGSAMHIHQSLIDSKTGVNLFSQPDGSDSPLFLQFIAGQQKYLPAMMPLLAPNVNSYRRLQRFSDAPINVHWSRDNRTTGLRVPESGPSARRVENRLAGADVNPYLAIAGSLAAGWLGIAEQLEPKEPVTGNAYERAHTLPRHLPDSLAKMGRTKELGPILGEKFIEVYMSVKQTEYDAYMKVISSWEREFLLLNV